MKTKWRPRLGSTFPRYVLRSIYFLKRYSEINVLPRMNLFPEMYSGISLLPQNIFQEVQTSESIFNSAANIFLECSRNIWSIKREGEFWKDGKHGTVRRCSHDFDDFDAVGQRLRHSADFRRGRNPVSHLWSDSSLWAAGRTLFRRLFFNALHDCTIVQVGHNSRPLTGCP